MYHIFICSKLILYIFYQFGKVNFIILLNIVVLIWVSIVVEHPMNHYVTYGYITSNCSYVTMSPGGAVRV